MTEYDVLLSVGLKVDPKAIAKYQAEQKKLGVQTDKAVTSEKALGTQLSQNTKLLDDDGKKTKALAGHKKTLSEHSKNMRRVIDGETKALGRHGASVGEQIKNAAKWAAIYFVLYRVIRGGQAVLKDFAKQISEINYAMVKLHRVMIDAPDDIGQLYAQSIPKLIKISLDYGVALKDVIETSVEWARQGRKNQEVMELTRLSVLMSNVAFMSLDDAYKMLTATMKQFNLSIGETAMVVDSVNEVSKRYAVTSLVIGDAIRRSGMAAKAAKVDYNELIGMITAVSEATQLGGERIGTALRTMMSYVYRPATINKVEDLTRKFGEQAVVIEKLGGQTNSFMEIILQLNIVWDKLSDIEQKQISQSIAGVRRSQEFLALMSRFPSVLSATITSLNAEGSAMKENTRLMESLQKQTQNLKNTITELYVQKGEAGGFDFLKGLVASATKLIEIIGKIHPMVFALVGAIIGIKVAIIALNAFAPVAIIRLVTAVKLYNMGMITAAQRTKSFTIALKSLSIAGFATLAVLAVMTAMTLTYQKQLAVTQKIKEVEDERLHAGERAIEENKKEKEGLDAKIKSYEKIVAILKRLNTAAKGDSKAQLQLLATLDQQNTYLETNAKSAIDMIDILSERIDKMKEASAKATKTGVILLQAHTIKLKADVAALEQALSDVAEAEKKQVDDMKSRESHLPFAKAGRGALDVFSTIYHWSADLVGMDVKSLSLAEQKVALSEKLKNTKKVLLSLEQQLVDAGAKALKDADLQGIWSEKWKLALEESKIKLDQINATYTVTLDKQKQLQGQASVYSKNIQAVLVERVKLTKELEKFNEAEREGKTLTEEELNRRNQLLDILKLENDAIDEQNNSRKIALAGLEQINAEKALEKFITSDLLRKQSGIVDLIKQEVDIRMRNKSEMERQAIAQQVILEKASQLNAALLGVRNTYEGIVADQLTAVLQKTAEWSDMLKAIGQQFFKEALEITIKNIGIGSLFESLSPAGAKLKNDIQAAFDYGTQKLGIPIDRFYMGVVEFSNAVNRMTFGNVAPPGSTTTGGGLYEGGNTGGQPNYMGMPSYQQQHPTGSPSGLEAFLQSPTGAGVRGGITGAMGGYAASGGNPWGAAIGGVTGAAGMAIGVANPLVGGLIMLAGMVAASFLADSGKQTQTSIEESLSVTDSKIDISNKHLEVIGRYLVDIKNAIEPYPMADSYYYRNRPGTGVQIQNLTITVGETANGRDVIRVLEDHLSTNSQRGYVAV